MRRTTSRWQVNTRWVKRCLFYSTIICAFWLVLCVLGREITPQTTAVIILGGGVTKEGTVPMHTQLRLDAAFELYRQLGQHALFFPLSGGTPHKPNPVDRLGFPVWECTAAAKRLVEMGVPPGQIFEETTSLDTIGNAYFLRAVHVHPAGLRKLVVITNDWHMPRTRAIFDFVFALPQTTGAFGYGATSALRGLIGSSDPIITYISAKAGVSDPHLLQVRVEKEAAALAQFREGPVLRVRSFQELHSWLFTQHSAYATSRLTNKPTNNIPADLLKTY